jgi:hypothetical protein
MKRIIPNKSKEENKEPKRKQLHQLTTCDVGGSV